MGACAPAEWDREEPTPVPILFMLDVDNTLLDNDRFAADLTARLERDFGVEECQRYWSLYAVQRERSGYADYLGALQLFRPSCADRRALLWMSDFLLEYPFQARLYPHALETLQHLRQIGAVCIVSDGDMVFQPRKIQRSGLWDAVGGQVLISLHKQACVGVIRQRFPARRYVMIDDKLQVLAEMKQVLGPQLTTVFVRQGHYAQAAGLPPAPPVGAPDLSVERIGDLRGFSPDSLQNVVTSSGVVGHPALGRPRCAEEPS